MIRAYHFVGGNLRDGRPVPLDGEWLIHDGPVVMCESGLHASRHPFDALQYAPGDVLCLVECDDIVEEGSDKFVCRLRRIIARFDASRMLREFAADCAEKVLHLAMPDAQLACIWAIDAARRLACGKCDDGELAAAYAAARAAADAAAYAAADAAACAAARNALRDDFAARVNAQFRKMGVEP